MNTQDLLNVIDIIKNSDLYNQRLEVLNKAEQAYKDAKVIAATIEQANKYRAEAETIRTEAHDLLAVAKKQKAEAEEELAKGRKKLAEDKQRLYQETEEKLAKAKAYVSEVKELEKQAKAGLEKVGSRSKMQYEQDKSLKERETLLKHRLEQMQQIMKEGLPSGDNEN